VAFILKSEASSVERGLEVDCAIDEKQTPFDIVFLPKFPEEICVRDVVYVENSRM